MSERNERTTETTIEIPSVALVKVASRFDISGDDMDEILSEAVSQVLAGMAGYRCPQEANRVAFRVVSRKVGERLKQAGADADVSLMRH